MQRYLINHLSPGTFILFLTAVILFIAFTILFITKRYFSFLIKKENNTFLSFSAEALSINYGLILGFIIISLWRDLSDVRNYVMHEAEYLALLIYNASAFPLSVQNEILDGIGNYIQVIIQEEWPLMKIGQVSENSSPAIANIFHIVQSYSPETTIESTFYNQFVKNLNKVVEYRRKRVEFLDSSLIDVLRFMLVLGMVVILFLCSLIYSKSFKLKVIVIILVGSMFSFNLGLVLLLDYPLSGSISASPTSLIKGQLARFNPENKIKPTASKH